MMTVAVVTGGNRGIGAAIAQRLAADGRAVVIGYGHDGEAAEAVCARIEAAGGAAMAIQADISQEAQAAALMEQAQARFGRLDVLVNNAAVVESRCLADIDAKHIDAQFAVNVRGLLLASKHAASWMGRGGSIVNISSINARGPIAEAPVYSATKAAVEALTKALARELGPHGIRVNAVAPGLIMTARHATDVPATVKNVFTERTPFGRLGTPDEVAGVVAFLASADAGWVTGEIIAATGGYGL
jgi:3-oxoacyl-[acyl-carrier protein] reductase